MALVNDCETLYTLVTNVDDKGYDFYIAQRYAQEGCWLTQERYQNLAKLNPPLGDMFEEIVIPPRLYAVFQTQRSVYPTEQEEELRKSILLEWLPGSEFELEEGIEITKMQWKMGEKRNQRYLELWMPVKTKIIKKILQTFCLEIFFSFEKCNQAGFCWMIYNQNILLRDEEKGNSKIPDCGSNVHCAKQSKTKVWN